MRVTPASAQLNQHLYLQYLQPMVFGLANGYRHNAINFDVCAAGLIYARAIHVITLDPPGKRRIDGISRMSHLQVNQVMYTNPNLSKVVMQPNPNCRL